MEVRLGELKNLRDSRPTWELELNSCSRLGLQASARVTLLNTQHN